MARILALDLGTVRTGVAVSDPTQTIAQPLAILDSRDLGRLKDEILRYVEGYEVERVVVGIPRSLSGKRGPMAHWAEGVRRQLAAYLPVPVDPWDERFSSLSAQRALHDAGVSDDGLCPRTDSAAAAVVLQGYLEHRRIQRERAERRG
jgi:putative Holliday junction resolvase